MTLEDKDIKATGSDAGTVAVNRGANPMRTVFYIILILFLLASTAAVVFGVFTAVTAVRGVKNAADDVINPVSELVRKLTLDATPVILPNPVMIVEEINSLARLETQSYSFQDIIQVERNKDMLWGAFGESLLFVAYGDVIAGVDLAKMEPADLQVASPTKVIVRLPEAEILVSTLDNERSYVADRDRGLLASVDPELETMVRQQAEARMLEAALADGVLEQAGDEAEKFIGSFLGELGFTEISFTESRPLVITPEVPELPKGFSNSAAPILVTPRP